MRETRLEAEYPFALIWRNIFGCIFSNIGRIAALANCCNLQTGEYRNSVLAVHIGSEEADYYMRLTHELLWKNWMRGSLEQQHTDILLYSLDVSAGIEYVLSGWLEKLAGLALIPISAPPEERILFASNLGLFLKLQLRRSAKAIASAPEERKVLTAVLDKVVWCMRERYSDPNLSLKALSQDLNLSERHLSRLVKEFLGQTFRQHLRDRRISEAGRLLTDTADDVKMIAGTVGYGDPSHFCSDFRMLMGCTPLEFRSKQAQKPMSDLLYQKSVFSY